MRHRSKPGQSLIEFALIGVLLLTLLLGGVDFALAYRLSVSRLLFIPNTNVTVRHALPQMRFMSLVASASITRYWSARLFRLATAQ